MKSMSQSFPLSLVQLDIYFDQLHLADNPTYNIGGFIRMGAVDVARLNSAHACLISSEDVYGLRILSKELSTEQGVRQAVSEQRTTELPLIDFSDEADPDKAATQWTDKRFQVLFELHDSELFNTCLVKVSDTEYRYVAIAHHLIMDGFGFANWARKLGEFYHDLAGEVDSLQPLSWRDIVDGDLKYLDGKKYQTDKAYWQQAFPAAPEPLLTPFYRNTFDNKDLIPSGREILTLPVSDYQALKAIANSYQTDMPQLLLAVLAVYFGSATGQDSLVIGLPAHNRRSKVQKQMLGVFTNISMMTVNIDAEQTLAGLTTDIAKQQKANYRHQRYPGGHVIRDLGLSGSGQRLYDLAFNFLRLDSDLEIGGSKAQLYYLSHRHEMTPLMVNVWEYGDSQPVEIQFDFNEAYFTAPEARLLINRFSHLLEQIKQKPDCVLASLDILTPQEVHTQKVEFNDSQAPVAADLCIHQLFERQAQQTPDNVALVFDDQQLSYRELNERANQLAHYLILQGVKPDTLVGLYVDRSMDLVVGLLAILKAGGAYV
ncbi:MAG: condensation domain-containing protein, partial [Psychrosphaera sp.]|nr:condensation domain-containing protein [Psychrosphaera sp.]